MKKPVFIAVVLSIVFGVFFPRFIANERQLATTYDGCNNLSECGQTMYQKGYPFSEQKRTEPICGLYVGPDRCPGSTISIYSGRFFNTLFWTIVFFILSATAIILKAKVKRSENHRD